MPSLRPCNAAADIIGADIYPVGYPPGAHSLWFAPFDVHVHRFPVPPDPPEPHEGRQAGS